MPKRPPTTASTTVDLSRERRADIPMILHGMHQQLPVGAQLSLGFGRNGSDPMWPPDLVRTVVEGAGFDLRSHPKEGAPVLVHATRARTLADTVAADMRLLLVGLNPSIYAADAGVGFARPGNRFWPAAIRAGIVTEDRDPVHALTHHHVGMTDLVKRATARASERAREDYVHGIERLDRLAAWLEPAVVCIVGLAGWRAAVDRKAQPGLHERCLGGRPVYVMPNPSGLDAHSSVDDLAEHLRAAANVADTVT